MTRRWRALWCVVIWLVWASNAAADPRCAAVATGGSVSLITVTGELYCVHQFSTAGAGTFTLLRNRDVQHLIIAGGGGGGTGGGGGGGMLEGSGARMPGAFQVTVGAGGGAGASGAARDGGNSTIFGQTAVGGGGGGGGSNVLPGRDGGSGGGGGRSTGSSARGGGAGVAGQGFNGAAAGNGTLLSVGPGGGGGGAGGVASNINGGPGRASSITGSPVTYAGGGASGDTGLIFGNVNGTPGSGAGNAGGGGSHRPVFISSTDPGLAGVVILRYIANFAPTANAGVDITALAGTSTALNGTGSTDPENNITTYTWTQISGPSVMLTGANTAQPNFSAPEPAGLTAVLVFQLTVTDAFGATSTDQVSVTVLSSVNPPPPSGTGGTSVTEFNDVPNNRTLRVHVFAGSGTFGFSAPGPLDYLIVGGGGGGGAFAGGGGGAGGLRTGAVTLPTGSYPIVVGTGGPGDSRNTWPTTTVEGGANGQPSSAFGIVAQGGGGGGTFNTGTTVWSGRVGGSGGGASHTGTGGSGTAGQGFGGATGTLGSGDSSGGGGGGAGQVGLPGTASLAGRGGNGTASAITGTSVTYAGGGAGGGDTRNNNGVSANIGGLGGGGASRNDVPAGNSGVNGLGGGGAGGRVGDNGLASSGGNGGAGVVIVRYVINTGPTANAGDDATALAEQLVTLDGTGSTDPDNNIVSYNWAQVAGTPVTLTDANTAQPSFSTLQPVGGPSEALSFQLTVTDAFGLSTTDTVVITLQGIAVLTADKTVTVFSEDGSECSDLSATSPNLPAQPAAIPGACITYLISVENAGPVAAQGIQLTDLLPSDLTFQAAGLGDNWGDGTILQTPASGCVLSDCIVAIEDGSIAAGQTATITIRAMIR